MLSTHPGDHRRGVHVRAQPPTSPPRRSRRDSMCCAPAADNTLPTDDVWHATRDSKMSSGSSAPQHRAGRAAHPPPPGRRVRAHVFLRMLSYYLGWHMKTRPGPILFCDHDNRRPRQAHRPGRRGATFKPRLAKASRNAPRRLPGDSFTSLLADLPPSAPTTSSQHDMPVHHFSCRAFDCLFHRSIVGNQSDISQHTYNQGIVKAYSFLWVTRLLSHCLRGAHELPRFCDVTVLGRVLTGEAAVSWRLWSFRIVDSDSPAPAAAGAPCFSVSCGRAAVVACRCACPWGLADPPHAFPRHTCCLFCTSGSCLCFPHPVLFIRRDQIAEARILPTLAPGGPGAAVRVLMVFCRSPGPVLPARTGGGTPTRVIASRLRSDPADLRRSHDRAGCHRAARSSGAEGAAGRHGRRC